ncbi:hypothetical protein D3C72_1583220 [compost metagenome]
MNPTLNDEEKVAAVTRGLFLCEGKIRTEPIQLTESYYLIAQETSSAQVQDAGDARNRTFFVALRSTNDFNRFLVAMKGQAQMPENAVKEKKSARRVRKLYDATFRYARFFLSGNVLSKIEKPRDQGLPTTTVGSEHAHGLRKNRKTVSDEFKT